MLQTMGLELRYALRTLARSPGYAFVAISLVALGITGALTTLALADRLFLARPSGVQQPESLVRASRASKRVRGNAWSHPDLAHFQDQAQEALDLIGFSGPRAMTAEVSTEPFSARVAFVTENYFASLGVPLLGGGQAFTSADGGAQTVAVVSHALALRCFGTSEGAVGRSLRLNGAPLTVVGVAPRAFAGVSAVEAAPDVWVPLSVYPLLALSEVNPLDPVNGRRMVWLQVIGRLRPGVTLTEARGVLDRVAQTRGDTVPEWRAQEDRVDLVRQFRLAPIARERLLRLIRLIGGVAAAVWLLALANFSLLILSRTASRWQEVTVRLALGAHRQKALAGPMMENLVVAALGGLLSLWLSAGTAGLLGRALPYPVSHGFGLSPLMLGAAFGLVLFTAFASGLVPALWAFRTNSGPLVTASAQAGNSSRSRDTLLLLQITLAVVLVSGALAFLRSFRAATAVNLGFETEGRLVISTDLAQHGYQSIEARSFLERAEAEAATAPGVLRAALATNLPFRNMMVETLGLGGGPTDEEGYDVELNFVSPTYFAVLGIPVLAGRGIAVLDQQAAPTAAVVSRKAADLLWPGGDAVGKRIEGLEEGPVVVGVVADVRTRDLAKDPPPVIYLSLAQGSGASLPTGLIVEMSPAWSGSARDLTERLRVLDPRVTWTNVSPLDEPLEAKIAPYRVAVKVVGLAAALALFLAAAGLYGSLSYQVVRQRQELAVRMALGAAPGHVAGVVVRRALRLACIGSTLGLATAWLVADQVDSLLFRTDPRDFISFLVVAVVLMAVALLASWLPARSIARLDPARALRH